MAITLIAGLASAGSAWAAAGFAMSLGAAFGAFAIGAGLSLVSRALMPKPDIGSQMGGRSVTAREAAHSRKIVYGRARLGGNIVYLESTGDDNKYLWLVVAVAGHEIDAYESVWFNDKKIWGDGNYFAQWSSYVQIGFFKGDQTTADNTTVSPRTDNLVNASSKWTDAHKLLDTAYMVFRLEHDVDQFAQGLPNISTIVRGKKVLDPSNNSTAWSDNPALCAYDYLRDTKYGLGETVANILTASVTTAKGVCDETVSLAAGGTQKRYTINGVVDTANSIKSNIEQMLGSMIGRLVYSGGQFEIHAGEYVAPAFTVDESVAVGEITVQTKQSRRSAYNGVKGVFLSEDDNYILADYPAQLSTSYATADGDPIYLDMALPFTTNNIRAQRIAKLALFRSRQQESISIPCNLSALRFKVGENINVTNVRLGYSNKIFEVVGYSMSFSDDGQIVVNVDAIETASSIWAWATSDEEVFLGGGEVALYDGTVAQPPTSINVTSDSFLSDDGTFNSQFNVAWTNADDAFTDHYVVEWKLASASNYFSQTTKSTPFSIVNLVNLQSYNVRVKAVNEIGVSSAPLNATVTSAKDTVAPAVPTQVTAAGGFEQITISWVNPTADDFKGVQVYRSNTQNGTYAYLDDADGTSFVDTPILLVNGAVVTRHYKLKSFDRSGNILTTPNNGFSGRASATTTLVPVGGIGNDAVTTSTIADQAVTTDTIDDDAVTIAKIATSLQSTNYSSGSAGWKIQKSGVVEFEQATIRGEIVASTGVIGGFTVGSTSLIAGANTTRVSLSTADGIHLGNNAFGSAPFRVTRAGALTASSATITGALTLTNVDGTTVNYSGGNLQVGTVQTGNIASDAVTNALIATDAVNQDSIAANSVTASAIVAGTITATEIATDAITAGKIDVANLAAINANMGNITAGSISSALITGDVTELYPVSLFPSSSMGTSGTTTYQDFWIPAPSSGIEKRQKVTADFAFTLNNTTSTSYKIYFQYGLQLKSKSALGISVGTVTHVSNPLSQHQLVSIAGNQLEKLDNQGSVAKTNNASGGSNAAATVRAVWFDHDDNKTYVLTANLGNTFSTNDTMFFSASKFASAGTFVSPNLIGQSAMYVPAGIELKVTLPLSNTFGASTTATNLRPFVIPYTNMNNVTGTFNYFKGTMENVS